MALLLSHEIVPIFTVPRRPFTQASTEGNDSVFARLFWSQRTLASSEEIHEQLG
jgi:hypothetical protein